MARFAVLGAGSWGTALAILLAKKEEHQVTMWEFLPDAAEKLINDRENKTFLAGAKFPERLKITNDIHEALNNAEAVLLCVPSQVTRKVLEGIKDIENNKVWIGASKGIENGTQMRMSEVFGSVFGEDALKKYVTLSGPSHAEEVALSVPTTVVAGGQDHELAKKVQEWFSGQSFRVYSTDDIVGVELGASLKNIVAIATGICDGLNFGDNTRGALITRGLHEMSRLGIVLGGKRETFAGLSGLGDLVTTCVSKHSRNRHVGEQLGLGRKLDDILDSMHMVAEGVATTKSAYNLSRKVGVEMPIATQVYKILFENASAKDAVVQLMTRSLKVEKHL